MAETIVAWRDRPNLCRVVAKWVHEAVLVLFRQKPRKDAGLFTPVP